MCLNFGIPPPGTKDAPLVPNQSFVMQLLLIIVLICVPLMLFVKPIYENMKHKKEDHEPKASMISSREEPLMEKPHLAINEGGHMVPQSALENYLHEQSSDNKSEDKDKSHSFGELFIH